MADFRELCAELVEYLALLDEPPQELVNRARAAWAVVQANEDMNESNTEQGRRRRWAEVRAWAVRHLLPDPIAPGQLPLLSADSISQ